MNSVAPRLLVVTLSDAIEKADVIQLEVRLEMGCIHYVEIDREQARNIAKIAGVFDDVGERYYGLQGKGWILRRTSNNRTRDFGRLVLTFKAK